MAESASEGPRPTGLALRLLSGIIVGPLLVFIAWIGGWVYAATVLLAVGTAAIEVVGMLRARGHQPFPGLLVGVALLIPFNAFLGALSPFNFTTALHERSLLVGMAGPAIDSMSMLVASAVMLSLVSLLFRHWTEGLLVDWALSLSLALYLGGLMQFFEPLRIRSDGAYWVISMLLVSWTCDSAAYFVGGAFGRRKLAPTVSPNKSVEGAVAGWVAAGAMGAAISVMAEAPPFSAGAHSWVLMAGFGLAVGLATVLGDLVESLIKRQTGVKDSGVLMPGHGGLMDRMDSILYCAPIASLYLLVVGVSA